VRAYGATAARLLARLPANPDWSSIARLDSGALRGQLAARRAEGIGNLSAARELSALKAFIAFAREQSGESDATPPRMRGPRVKKGLPRPITPDEAVSLAAGVAEDAAEEWIAARDRAVLLLLYGAGLRIAEALALPASVLPLGETLTVTGKGNRQRVVPILPIVRDALALEPFGLLVYELGRIMPFLLVIAAFTFIYMFIPNTRVEFGPALPPVTVSIASPLLALPR